MDRPDQCRIYQKAWAYSNLLFPGSKGGPLTKHALRNALLRLAVGGDRPAGLTRCDDESDPFNALQTRRVEALFPEPAFAEVLEAGTSGEFTVKSDLAKLTGALSGSQQVITDLAKTWLKTHGVELQASADAAIKWKWVAKCFTPRVMAIGLEGFQPQWSFLYGSTPLYGIDIRTFACVDLPEAVEADKHFAYRARLHLVLGNWFRRVRRTTRWETVTCSLKRTYGKG